MRNRWGKSVLYGEATRVPLILAGPGIPRGRRCSTPASLLDIVPTELEALEIPAPGNCVGRSLLELLREGGADERFVFSEYHAARSPAGAFMVAGKRWKFHHDVGNPPELFDLEVDPPETANLAEDSGHIEVVREMRRRLHEICDPESVDQNAKSDQNALIARHGGREAALRIGPPGATPIVA